MLGGCSKGWCRIAFLLDLGNLLLHLVNAGLVFALADDGQIRQVLLNLATNASEAVVSNGGRGAVTISARRGSCDQAWLDRALLQEGLEPGEYALLRVEDDGIGLEADQIAKIFDPFYSSKGTGRGLGLSSTLGVIRAHGGTIVVESEPGVGSTFTFSLPRDQLDGGAGV